MGNDVSPVMYEYVLEFSPEQEPSNDKSAGIYAILSNTLLFENIFWYCRFRWVVIALLVTFGVFSAIPGLFEVLHLRAGLHWPFTIAGILLVSNIAFLSHARTLEPSISGRSIRFNIWSQILLDLIILTGVVHFVGSLETPILFTYLLHIILACIFFTRFQSFLVTVSASIAFIFCVSLEVSGILSPGSIYASPIPLNSAAHDPLKIVLPMFIALSIWFVVWYLVSHLSEMTRKRDYELITTNQQLQEKQEEEKKHIMWMTHELKAPLAAIDSNVMLIQNGYCGVIPEKALEVVGRIAARSKKFGQEIQEMLQLANIRTVKKDPVRLDTLDLSQIITGCIAQIRPSADERNIRFELELNSVSFTANEDHMKMLFINVISNAVSYSYDNGAVRITCSLLPDSRPFVEVEDHGIGIAHNKIIKIFDEYYHTSEAVEHNRNSTGIGLAIVKQLAQTYHLSIHVFSLPNVGTRFEIGFPHLFAQETKQRDGENR